MNKLPAAKRAQILSMLVEGSSMRSVARLADVSINTVSKLLESAGLVCAAYHNETVRNVNAKRIQCDEIWSFVGAKQRHATDEQKEKGWGDCWTWTALDADSKLLVSYLVGIRGPHNCYEFMKDVASRLATRVQLTTDGLKYYLDAVDHAFGIDIDYGQIQKRYSSGVTDGRAATRYSPAKFLSAAKEVLIGDPAPQHISTSFVERANLTMRMSMRRFTRLTNGYSKKVENHAHMVAIYTVWYNWIRVHQTLRVTPAMQAGLADQPYEMTDLVALIEQAEMPMPAQVLSESHSA